MTHHQLTLRGREEWGMYSVATVSWWAPAAESLTSAAAGGLLWKELWAGNCSPTSFMGSWGDKFWAPQTNVLTTQIASEDLMFFSEEEKKNNADTNTEEGAGQWHTPLRAHITKNKDLVSRPYSPPVAGGGEASQAVK